jgi:hypothetical protein
MRGERVQKRKSFVVPKTMQTPGIKQLSVIPPY